MDRSLGDSTKGSQLFLSQPTFPHKISEGDMVLHTQNTTISSIFRQANAIEKNTPRLLENDQWLSTIGGMETFNQRLKRLAKAKGFTQETLGDAMGLSQGAISKWYRGTAKPSDENMARLSEMFGVNVAYLEHGYGGTSEAAELMGYIDDMTDEQRKVLLEMARQLHAVKPKKSIS